MHLSKSDDSAAWEEWFSTARLPRIDTALRAFYERLDAEIAAGDATCWQSGKCCRFDASFRLYVTGLEIAWFVVQSGEPTDSKVTAPAAADADSPSATMQLPVLPSSSGKPVSDGLPCPYLVDGLCSTHTVRPMGCRIYFCQPGTQQWQQMLYERYLAELRALHDCESVDYAYMEWLGGLRAAREHWRHEAGRVEGA